MRASPLSVPPGLRHNRPVDARLDDFLSRYLLLDLETAPNGDIHKIGAMRGKQTFRRQGCLDAHRPSKMSDSRARGLLMAT